LAVGLDPEVEGRGIRKTRIGGNGQIGARGKGGGGLCFSLIDVLPDEWPNAVHGDVVGDHSLVRKQSHEFEPGLAVHGHVVAAVIGLGDAFLAHIATLKQVARPPLSIAVEVDDVADEFHVGMIEIKVDAVADPGVVHEIVTEGDIAEVSAPLVVSIEGPQVVGDKAPAEDLVELKNMIHAPVKNTPVRGVVNQVVGHVHSDSRVVTTTSTSGESGIDSGSVDKC